jgi:ATP-dependent RNA helicase DBP3
MWPPMLPWRLNRKVGLALGICEILANDHLASATDKKKKKRKRDEVLDDTEFPEKKEKKEKKTRKQPSVSNDPTPSPTSQNCSSSTSKIVSPAPVPAASQAEVTEFLTKHSITIHTPDNTPAIPPVLSFDQLDIPSDLQSSFAGFKEPTPIQACAWPLALQGLDVVGIAETGRWAIFSSS